MSLKQYAELVGFFSTYIAESAPESDGQTTRDFAAKTAPERRLLISGQIKRLIESPTLSLEDLGTESNRWFGDAEEARAWLTSLSATLEGEALQDSIVVVKDSNGTPLAEGDSVTVIKDLKVKGGTSDLKRGTLIKKIHLIGDPDNIECRVDGSTLVLKTIFLRKS